MKPLHGLYRAWFAISALSSKLECKAMSISTVEKLGLVDGLLMRRSKECLFRPDSKFDSRRAEYVNKSG